MLGCQLAVEEDTATVELSTLLVKLLFVLNTYLTERASLSLSADGDELIVGNSTVVYTLDSLYSGLKVRFPTATVEFNLKLAVVHPLAKSLALTLARM